MTERLTINGAELDLKPSQITRDLRIADLGDLTARKSNISNSFNILRTAKNESIFKMAGVSGNQSRVPYLNLDVRYYIDTELIIENGFLRIEETTPEFYKVRVIDGILNLADRLKGLKIKDLPLDDLNHLLTANEVINSFTNTSGYIYGYADFGLGYDKSNFMPPSVYVHTLFDRIFTANGLEYESSFLSSDAEYRKEVIPPAAGVILEESEPSFSDNGGANSNVITFFEESGGLEQVDNISTEGVLSYTNVDLTGFTVVNGNLVSSEDKKITVDLSTNYYLRANNVLRLEIKVNGLTRASIDLEPASQNVKSSSVTLNVESGDVLSVKYVASANVVGNDGETITLDFNLRSDLSFTKVVGGVDVNTKEYMPELKQSDLVKDVLSRYGMMLSSIDGDPNRYRIERIEDVLKDSANAIDWTEKLAKDGPESYDPDLSQRNIFKFKYTKDRSTFPNDGVLEVDNQKLGIESDYYSAPYEIPELTNKIASNPLYGITLFESKEGEIETKESPVKLMKVSMINGTIQVGFFDDVPISFIGLYPTLSLDGVEMQKYIDENYAEYKKAMDSYSKREVELYLTPTDIRTLKLDRLYYFAQYGRRFLIQSVRYKVGENSKVTLIQL